MGLWSELGVGIKTTSGTGFQIYIFYVRIAVRAHIGMISVECLAVNATVRIGSPYSPARRHHHDDHLARSASPSIVGPVEIARAAGVPSTQRPDRLSIEVLDDGSLGDLVAYCRARGTSGLVGGLALIHRGVSRAVERAGCRSSTAPPRVVVANNLAP